MLDFVIFIVYLAIGYLMGGCTELLYTVKERETERLATYVVLMLFWPIGVIALLFALIDELYHNWRH